MELSLNPNLVAGSAFILFFELIELVSSIKDLLSFLMNLEGDFCLAADSSRIFVTGPFSSYGR